MSGLKRSRKTTAVPDRSPGVPLGHEARALANALAAFGYEDDVPAVKDPRWWEWFKANTQPGMEAKRVPQAYIAWTIAILRQIQEREDQPPGRPLDPGIAAVEMLAEAIPVIDAARLQAHREAPPAKEGATKAELDERNRLIEERAQYLAHKVYERRSRKGDMPKPK